MGRVSPTSAHSCVVFSLAGEWGSTTDGILIGMEGFREHDHLDGKEIPATRNRLLSSWQNSVAGRALSLELYRALFWVCALWLWVPCTEYCNGLMSMSVPDEQTFGPFLTWERVAGIPFAGFPASFTTPSQCFPLTYVYGKTWKSGSVPGTCCMLAVMLAASFRTAFRAAVYSWEFLRGL